MALNHSIAGGTNTAITARGHQIGTGSSTALGTQAHNVAGSPAGSVVFQAQLAAPAISFNSGTRVLSWSAVTNATGYTIRVNGNAEWTTNTASFVLPNNYGTGGNFSITVIAAAAGFVTSNASNVVSVYFAAVAGINLEPNEDFDTEWSGFQNNYSGYINVHGWVLTGYSFDIRIILNSGTGTELGWGTASVPMGGESEPVNISGTEITVSATSNPGGCNVWFYFGGSYDFNMDVRVANIVVTGN